MNFSSNVNINANIALAVAVIAFMDCLLNIRTCIYLEITFNFPNRHPKLFKILRYFYLKKNTRIPVNKLFEYLLREQESIYYFSFNFSKCQQNVKNSN